MSAKGKERALSPAKGEAPHVSTRQWIKWEGEQSSEPTNTLVVTSAGNRFVDIRVKKYDPNSGVHDFPGIQGLHQLDWAFAGTSSSERKQGEHFQTHSKWFHWIDSNSAHPDEFKDEGTMIPDSSGRVLEHGTMIHPVKGEMTPYTECWLDAPLKKTAEQDQGIWNAVLVLDEPEKMRRGMVIRVGQVCQGILREGARFTVEQWTWAVEGGWKRLTRMGDDFLPCGMAMDPERLGKTVTFKHPEGPDKDHVWEVKERKFY
ncbi:Hypothetical predicted protein [Lecanosticta acicola]|uniref:Protein HRI1 n=1 Tax=Lecanosticta acicola TaxID=111012 RepID=A0AAI8Z104_9PEZI|nr:Hypothetical predicted protein [Lecanosticta acicola]